MPNDIHNSNKLQSYPPYTLPFGDTEIVQTLPFQFNTSTFDNGYFLYSSSTNTYTIAAGTPMGVLQQLSTRKFGEVVSSDAY